MDSTIVEKNESDSALEISLLGERFRLKPTRDRRAGADQGSPDEARLAREAIEWANRQILVAEKRLKSSSTVAPRAHHVALLALVELAHEALIERNRTADSLNGLIDRLEKLKALKASASPVAQAVRYQEGASAGTIESLEASWLEDQPTGASALVPPA